MNPVDLICLNAGISFALGLLGGFFGAYLNHRFALFRDARKEFVEARQALRRPVLADHDRPSAANAMPDIWLVDQFELMLSGRHLERFRTAFEAYRQARQEAGRRAGPRAGAVRYSPEDVCAVRAAAAALLKVTVPHR